MPMRKSRFTEEQIAHALRQAETGTPVTEVCRAMGISEQTYYHWKKKYGGLGIHEIRRLKLLEERTVALSNWWRTSRWTKSCCRTCCEKNCEA